MGAPPLISVIIPSYNHARFLPSCVQSVASQGYSELELIVIDDRSSDTSPQVLDQLTQCDELRSAFRGRFHFEVNEENRGAHETINRGIALSRGEYVCVLNSDDLYAENRLVEMMSHVESSGVGLAFSKVEFIDEHGLLGGVQPDAVVHKLERRQNAIEKFPSVGFACLASNVAISTGNLLFTRRLFDTVGPFGNLRYCHDWDFLLRCLLETEPLYVPSATYMYRIHGTNSFKSLDHIAAAESAIVYRSYFSNLILNRHANRRAPSPSTWPGVFDVFMSSFGLWQYWEGERA